MDSFFSPQPPQSCFTVKTELVDDTIHQRVTDLLGVVSEKVIATQDSQIRQALIALGWTPPEEKNSQTEDENRKMKIAVYAIAIERKECYGHGEYGNLLSIEQQGAYGPGPAFFHPVFLSKKKAEDYHRSLNSFEEIRIVPLELEVNSATIDIDSTEIIEDESKNRWKAAIVDYLVCAHLLNNENENNPRKAIGDIVKLLQMRPEDYREP